MPRKKSGSTGFPPGYKPQHPHHLGYEVGQTYNECTHCGFKSEEYADIRRKGIGLPPCRPDGRSGSKGRKIHSFRWRLSDQYAYEVSLREEERILNKYVDTERKRGGRIVSIDNLVESLLSHA